MAGYQHRLFITLAVLLYFTALHNTTVGEKQLVHLNITCEQNEIIFGTSDLSWQMNSPTWYGLGSKCHSLCPVQCTCITNINYITRNCSDGVIVETTIPYPFNVSNYLSWSDSILHGINSKAFEKFAHALYGLDLRNVSLQYLHVGAFDGIEFLKLLALDYNNLKKIDTTIFSDLVDLEYLDLSYNSIHNIAPGSFKNLSKLAWLYLSNNRLTRILPVALAALVKLDLSNNHLADISHGTFNNLGNLRAIDFSDNRLINLEPGVFKGLTSLVYIYLDNNNLTEISPNTFNNLTGLEDLILSHNQLTRIVPGTFINLPALFQLDLSNNLLTSLLPDTLFWELDGILIIHFRQ